MEENKKEQTQEINIGTENVEEQKVTENKSKTATSDLDPMLAKAQKKKKNTTQFSEEDEKLYKTKMRSLIVNSVLIILMAIYLLNANQILFAFTKGSTELRPVKHTLEQYPNSAPTYGQIEEISYLGGLTRNVRFYGWAFTESEEILNPVNKQTKIVLTGPSGSFEADCVVAARPDIFRNYGNTYKVPNGSVGFEARFSTLPLKSGTYTVQLFSQENEDIVGLSAPIMQVVVEPTFVYDIKFDPIDNFTDLQPSEEVQIGIDKVEKMSSNPQMLLINGWGMDMRGYDPGVSTYLQIKNTKGKIFTYEVERTLERKDLIAPFKINPDNILLGFITQCKIPRNFGEISEIAFIVSKDGEYRISAQPFTYDSNPIKEVEHLSAEYPVDNFEDIKQSPKVTMAVDTLTRVKYDESLYTITGWALNDNGRNKNSETYLMVTAPNGKSVTYPLKLTGERIDLIEAFGIKEGVLSGFSQDFKLTEEMDGIKTISVLFKEKNNVSSPEKPFENTQGEIPVAKDSLRVKGGDSIDTSVSSDLVLIGMDSLSVENGTLNAEGWAVCLPDLPDPQAAILQITDSTGETVNLPIEFSVTREDVASVHKFSGSKLVGFTLKSILPENFGDIKSLDVIFDCGGEYYNAEEPYMV